MRQVVAFKPDPAILSGSGFSTFDPTYRTTIHLETTYFSSRPHPTIVVEVGDFREDIDIDLAPIIKLLWEAGIETMMCCQETDPGIAWIEFGHSEDVARFLNRILNHDESEDSLYARSNWQRFVSPIEGSWEYQFNLFDGLEDHPDQTECGTVDLLASVGVYFPRSDIESIRDRLQSSATPQSKFSIVQPGALAVNERLG